MKRWLATTLTILYSLSLMIPAKAAPVEDDTPAHITFHTHFVTNAPGPDDAVDTMTWTGSNHANGNGLTLDLSCDVDGCNPLAQDIYVDITINLDWSSPYEDPPTLWSNFEGNADVPTLHSDWQFCQPDYMDYMRGSAGTGCKMHFSGKIDKADLQLQVGSTNITNILAAFGTNSKYGAMSWSYTYTLVFSTSPISTPCNYTPSNIVAAGNIDPTSETGSVSTLVVGQYYILSTTGGPWNDGNHDRYDAAYRQGASGPWTAMGNDNSVLCSSLDGTNATVVFTATSAYFAIRVNDYDGYTYNQFKDPDVHYSTFADNTGSLTYTLSETIGPLTGTGVCDNYLTGSQIETATIAATNSDGINVSAQAAFSWPMPGSWLAIQVASGSWYDNGAGPLKDLAIKISDGAWQPLLDFGGVIPTCLAGSTWTYYIQVGSRNSHFLRVNDADGNFSNNTGSINLVISNATYNPPNAACEAKFNEGAFIESKTVSATDGIGVILGDGSSSFGSELPLAMTTGANEGNTAKYLMLEITGEPIFNGADYSALGDIAPGGSIYYEASVLPGVECVNYLDNLGKVRIYFPVDQDLFNHKWKFRAHDADGNRANNNGHLSYSLYYVDKWAMPPVTDFPPAGNCPMYSDTSTIETSMTLQGNDDVGQYIKVFNLDLSPGLYSIKTSGGPWENNGISSYEIAIREDSDAQWYLIYKYPYALCSESVDSTHYRTYIHVMQGKHYKLAVYDPGGNFIDNSSSINATVYAASTTINDWTPCSNNYIQTLINIPDDQRKFLASSSSGIPIPQSYLTAGKTYGLEITDESTWNTISPLDASNLYAAQVNNNGGAWVDMSQHADWIICAVQKNLDPNNQRMEIFFTANGSYNIRVDGDPVWFTNTGYLMFRLYSVADATPVPPCTGSDCANPIPPPPWVTTCDEAVTRPTSLVDWIQVNLGTILDNPIAFSLPIPAAVDWIEYARASIQQYLAWCPSVSSELETIPAVLAKYQPFGMIYELTDTIKTVNDKLDAIGSSGGESNGQYTPFDPIMGTTGTGGEGNSKVTSSTWQGIIPNLTDQSPWMGGKIKWTGESLSAMGGEASSYVDYCSSVFETRLGPGATKGLCTIFMLSRLMGFVWILIQLAFSGSAVLATIQYVMKKWVDSGAAG